MSKREMIRKGLVPFIHETREEYVAEVVKAFRRRTHKGRNWRKRAWNFLYNGVKNEGRSVRKSGPVALAVYAGYVGLAVEYLGKHPDDPERFVWLRDRVWMDLDTFDAYCETADLWMFTEEEVHLVETAFVACLQYLDRIAIHCPDTT